MNIVQITPGAGRMFCGNCFRDNALVAELRRQGHETLMVPLYLPLTLDEADQSQGTPVFFSGVNVYLDQQFGWFRRWTPPWFRRWLASPLLLRMASGRAAKTRAADVGELTLSMLRGEDGNQARDLDELARWLEAQPPPDVVCLSNAMLLGLARELKRRLRAPVICMLQGEDGFLDELQPRFRDQAWQVLTERARDADRFVTPSRFFADYLGPRLRLDPAKIDVVPNGINLEGFPRPSIKGRATAASAAEISPAIGYFARMCRDKGLDLLIDAFIALHERGRVRGVRLRVGGGCGPSDEPLVAALESRLREAGLADQVEWVKNPDRDVKLRFLNSLTVFSVPARCAEAFGLYVIEALASGVPVVLPRFGAFVELVERSQGGLLCSAGDPQSLAQALETVLVDDALRARLARSGHEAAHRDYGVTSMARDLLQVFHSLRQRSSDSAGEKLEAKPVVSRQPVR